MHVLCFFLLFVNMHMFSCLGLSGLCCNLPFFMQGFSFQAKTSAMCCLLYFSIVQYSMAFHNICLYSLHIDL